MIYKISSNSLVFFVYSAVGVEVRDGHKEYFCPKYNDFCVQKDRREVNKHLKINECTV